ncbi:MAG: LegC family aminotransferase [Anaerolineae bacterium]|nr:LegC family aminotransferase [Anaerolineae bacterium]
MTINNSPLPNFEPGAPLSGDGIPLCVPEIRGNEWRYIKDCLDTNWVSSVGKYVTHFEEKLAAYVGTQHAIATSNGTAALHIALLVAGVEPDDEVLVSALTFIAPANAVRYASAWPVFIDAEPRYWQMDTQKVADFLENDCRWTSGALFNKQTGRRVKAIIPVHILGHPVDIDPILSVARKYNLAVIEDATESLGASYKGRNVGALGDMACFSFNGNKIITTGGGGMLVTDRDDFAAKARYLTTQAKDDPLEYIHHQVGYNYRLTNIQAAMGVAQLELLDEYIAIKSRIANTYTQAFDGIPGIHLMEQAEWANSIFWLNTILVDAAQYGLDSRQLMHKLARNNIQSRPLWQPLHRSPAYMDTAFSMPCPVADLLNRAALSLPSSVGLSAQDQQRVIELLRVQAN